MRESSVGDGHAVLLLGLGNPDHCLCPPRSHLCPFLSVLVLTPVQPHPYTFRGFSHVLPTPQNSLPSSGLFRLKLRNSSQRPALPDRSSSPGLAAPCVGHTCVTPTEPDQGLCFVPPATRCMPTSQLSHLVLWLSTFSSVFPPDTGFLEQDYAFPLYTFPKEPEQIFDT